MLKYLPASINFVIRKEIASLIDSCMNMNILQYILVDKGILTYYSIVDEFLNYRLRISVLMSLVESNTCLGVLF